MRLAFTFDDLPVYPHLALMEGYSPKSVSDTILAALAENGLGGVYNFANSWPLDVEPALAGILDDWVAAGHHIGNHTHSHPLLNDVGAEDFIHDIDVGEELLAPWLNRAPVKAFRYPLDLWGDTEEKRAAVKAHLDARGYAPGDVTSWFQEWEWDRAWQWLLKSGRAEEANALKGEFIDYAVAQLAHDRAQCRAIFGHDIIGIGLAHNVAFFAEVAGDFFARLRAEGIEFVALEEALADPAYARAASFVSARFQLYPYKLAELEGRRYAEIPPASAALMQRVIELATPLRPARRGQLVVNRRPRPPG